MKLHAGYDRYEAVFKSVKQPRLIRKCFFFLSSFSSVASSIGLLIDCPTLLRKLSYHKLL